MRPGKVWSLPSSFIHGTVLSHWLISARVYSIHELEQIPGYGLGSGLPHGFRQKLLSEITPCLAPPLWHFHYSIRVSSRSIPLQITSMQILSRRSASGVRPILLHSLKNCKCVMGIEFSECCKNQLSSDRIQQHRYILISVSQMRKLILRGSICLHS